MIDNLMSEYFQQLRTHTKIQQEGEFYSICFPFLDRHNDYLELYVRPVEDNRLLITDDGFSITDAVQRGVDFTSLQWSLSKLLDNTGIAIAGNKLKIICSKDKFHESLNKMIVAVIQIGGIY